METVLFYLLGIVTLASAICVVFLRRPLHNVLFMIVTMVGLAGLFILLHAEFIAMVQLVVYAGAVMVLFLFVIMLLNLDRLQLPKDTQGLRRWAGVALTFGFIVLIFPVLRIPGDPAKPAEGSNTQRLAEELFTTYLLPFEVASVLLLAAIIGAVILTKRRTPKPSKAE